MQCVRCTTALIFDDWGIFLITGVHLDGVWGFTHLALEYDGVGALSEAGRWERSL